MEIKINGIEQNICDFSTDILIIEKSRIEKKICNMEYISAEEITSLAVIEQELERRSEC